MQKESKSIKNIVLPLLIAVVLISVVFIFFENLEFYFTDLLHQSESQKRMYVVVSFLILFSDILLPVPSSIVMYTNGFVLGTIQGTVLSLVSSMASSFLGYYIGRFTSLGFKTKENKNADLLINKYGLIAILVTRGIPILSESISLVCGYNKMKLKTFLLVNLIGYLPVCILYALLGNIAYTKDAFIITFGGSLIFAVLFLLAGKKYFMVKKEFKGNTKNG